MKLPKMVIPIVAIGIIGMASFAAPAFSSIEKTPEIKGSVFYSMKDIPSGFSLTPGYNNSDLPEITGKQNPNPIKNQAGTCTFSPQVAYLPSTAAGRGDKYLTLSYIYENAQISTHLPTAIKKDHVSAGDTFLEVLTSSYDVADSKSNSDDKKGYYRTIAVRALDTTVPIPYGVGSDSKGLPTIVMTYDCQTVNDYKDSDFTALLSSVNVNLTDTVSNEVPKKDTVSPTQSATPTGSPSAPESPSERPSEPMANSSTVSPTSAAEGQPSPSLSENPSNP